MNKSFKFEDFKGMTFVAIHQYADELVFVTKDDKYKMYHYQDCCESVELEDVCGDLNDLIGSPILLAEEVTSNDPKTSKPPESYESYTWTFYKLATSKGYVTLRWLGQSNGYYSESVDVVKIS